MSRYGLVRVLTVVALAATLLMGSAAPVSAVERPQAVKVWSWLETLWRTGLGVWGPGGTRLEKQGACIDPDGCSISEKGGPCIDPDGCANAEATNTSAKPPCVRLAEGGPCIDPDG